MPERLNQPSASFHIPSQKNRVYEQNKTKNREQNCGQSHIGLITSLHSRDKSLRSPD